MAKEVRAAGTEGSAGSGPGERSEKRAAAGTGSAWASCLPWQDAHFTVARQRHRPTPANTLQPGCAQPLWSGPAPTTAPPSEAAGTGSACAAQLAAQTHVLQWLRTCRSRVVRSPQEGFM